MRLFHSLVTSGHPTTRRPDHPHTLFLALLLVLPCGAARAQQWSEGFEGGAGSAKPYHADAPTTRIEVVAGDAAEGKQYLRAALPGKRRLEGINVTATGLAGGRLATVTAKVRGKGEVWLCLIGRNGWLYSPRTLPLTDRWQELSLSKVVPTGDTTLGIHFLSKEIEADALFKVDDVRVALAPAPKVYDAAVGPWRFEAEEHASRASWVAADADASGGKVMRDGRYLSLEGIPFPRTSRPVAVYLKARPGATAEQYRLTTRQGGNEQILASVKPGKPGEWQWLRFPPLSAGDVGDTLGVACWRDKDTPEVAAVDSLVLSTRADLDAAALDGAPLLFGNRPLAVVARAAAPPVLDGKADDLCWRNAVACTGFLVGKSLSPAEAATTARLCYDDRNLYALFECEEPILRTEMQRRHEFRAKVEQRDAEVYGDDSCVLLLDPGNTGKQAFDFTVNALGTLADARCAGPDLWGTRDVRWNSGAAARGSAGEGTWTIEIAIPFADLCGKAPSEGDVWQACLGRIARARKESTSWNPSNRGFHDPYALGRLLFAGATPGALLTAPAALQPGKNRVDAAVTPVVGRAQGAYLCAQVVTPARHGAAVVFTDASEAPVLLACPFEVAEEAELEVAYALLDAATLRPLALTPRLKRAVRSTVAKVTLACDGPYELILNDEVIARGEHADATEVRAPLQKGTNAFALRVEKGTAAVRLEAPGLMGGPVKWRVAPADTRDATLAATDDSAWSTAPKVGEHPKCGVILGQPGKPMVLRHTLLWEKTRAWPTPVPALYIARGTPQHLTFIADGLPKRKLLDWSVTLAVPPAFEILGSTGYYGERDNQPLFLCKQLGEQDVEGRPMRLARITATKPVLSGRHPVFSLFNAFVRCPADMPEPKEGLQILYWSEANDGTIIEPLQSIPVRLLPPLKGRQPGKLVWQLWGSWLSSMDDRGMREAVMQTAQAAGFNDMVAGDRWTSDNAPRFGMKHTMGVNFQPWSMNLGPYLEQHPEERLVDKEGKPGKGLLCTSLLLDRSWPAVEAALAKKLEEVRPHTADYDYEYSPFDGPHSCYCPRCLQAFREHAHLPAGTPLDPAAIKEKHAAAWVDFMAWRVAQMFAKLKESVHRLAPGVLFSAYSGYQAPDNPQTYGIDWAYFGKLQAADRIGCGYGRPVEHLKTTIDALAGIPALFGELLYPYETKETVPQTPATKATLLRRSLDATGGVLVYERQTMDGRSWLAAAETTRLVAEFEGLFLTGKRSALPGLDPASLQVLSDGKTTLICVMNESSSPAERRVPLPSDAGAGSEFYSGAKVAAGEAIRVTLPPGEAAVYVLRR